MATTLGFIGLGVMGEPSFVLRTKRLMERTVEAGYRDRES